MYVVCLLFSAIGGVLFVTMFVLNRPNVVDTISGVASRIGTSIYYLMFNTIGNMQRKGIECV